MSAASVKTEVTAGLLEVGDLLKSGGQIRVFQEVSEKLLGSSTEKFDRLLLESYFGNSEECPRGH
jgi:hypothetical protein